MVYCLLGQIQIQIWVGSVAFALRSDHSVFICSCAWKTLQELGLLFIAFINQGHGRMKFSPSGQHISNGATYSCFLLFVLVIHFPYIRISITHHAPILYNIQQCCTRYCTYGIHFPYIKISITLKHTGYCTYGNGVA